MSSASQSFNKVLINNNSAVIDKVVNKLQKTIRNDKQFRFSLADVRRLIIESAEIINKRHSMSEQVNESGKMQSVSWYFINEFLSCEVDGDLLSALNKLLLTMSETFENVGTFANSLSEDFTYIDVARDLNETMKLCAYPITFHDDMYGKRNSTYLRGRCGKSSLRRPIAKAELVLAWAAHLLRLTRTPAKFTNHELSFINALGAMLNAFTRRFDFIVNLKYQNPCIDQLAFIRLMEVVYVSTIKREWLNEYNLYASWFDSPDKFKFIDDFMDIRLSSNSAELKSHLSRLPRMTSTQPVKCTIFYNPVECLEGSPIHDATVAWIDAEKAMQVDLSFENIVKNTAVASFDYEKNFVGIKQEEVPEWYNNVKSFDLFYDDEDIFKEQLSAIEEHLTPLKSAIEDTILSNGTDDAERVAFGVKIKESENATPVLAYINV